jgi:hypothetical protein
MDREDWPLQLISQSLHRDPFWTLELTSGMHQDTRWFINRDEEIILVKNRQWNHGTSMAGGGLILEEFMERAEMMRPDDKSG